MMTPVGLRFPTDLTFDSWERAGRQIAGIVDSSAWCLGDWLIYGQQQYADRYQRAIKLAGLDYQTLRNYAWVARKFDLSRRRDALSFQHHAEVAALPMAEQDVWLERAERFEWSRNQLRINLQKSRSRFPAKPSRLPRLAVEEERIERWREAAEQANVQFEKWIVTVLDRAARDS
jgi:hypothetical protein